MNYANITKLLYTWFGLTKKHQQYERVTQCQKNWMI